MVGDVSGPALVDSHVEGVEDDLRRERGRHRPSDDATTPSVEHDGEVEEARPGRHVVMSGTQSWLGPSTWKLRSTRSLAFASTSPRVVVLPLRQRVTPTMRLVRMMRATRWRPTRSFGVSSSRSSRTRTAPYVPSDAAW